MIYAKIKSEFGMHHMSRPEFNYKGKLSKRPTATELKKWFDKLPRGLPATIPLKSPRGSSNYIALNDKHNLSGFWKSLLRLAWPRVNDISSPLYLTEQKYSELIDKAYNSLTKGDRAFTNYDPTKYQKYVCTGATVEIVGERFWFWGSWLYAIKTLNINALPDPFSLSFPGPFVCAAINSTKIYTPDGKRVEESFPQLGGRPVPYPIMSQTGISYIEEAWIEKFVSETDPLESPFYPPK